MNFCLRFLTGCVTRVTKVTRFTCFFAPYRPVTFLGIRERLFLGKKENGSVV